MRVLLRDESDNTMFVVEANDVCYDPDENELYVNVGEETQHVVRNITGIMARSAVYDAWKNGMVDLSDFESIRCYEDGDDD